MRWRGVCHAGARPLDVLLSLSLTYCYSLHMFWGDLTLEAQQHRDSTILSSLSSTRISCQQDRMIKSVLAHRRAVVWEHMLIHTYHLI